MILQPLISIITPCYNYGKFLTETLENILEQTYQNWECIIVNDGSTDNTKEICLKYIKIDQRFKYIYQENKGLSGARNTALNQAKGKYIQLLDSDDLLESNKLNLQVQFLEKNPQIDLIYSKITLFESDDLNRSYIPFNLPNDIQPSGKNEPIITALIEDNFFLPGCVMFRTELFRQVGNFDESLYGLEDWDYWTRAALLGKGFYSDNREGTKLKSRNHQSNMSKVYDKMLISQIQVRQHIIKFIKELKEQKKLEVDDLYIKKILRKHYSLLALNEYDYHMRYGKKILGVLAAIKYLIIAKDPLFIVKKLKSSLERRNTFNI